MGFCSGRDDMFGSGGVGFGSVSVAEVDVSGGADGEALAAESDRG